MRTYNNKSFVNELKLDGIFDNNNSDNEDGNDVNKSILIEAEDGITEIEELQSYQSHSS